MQQNQVSGRRADEQDNPALSKVIERNIRTTFICVRRPCKQHLADLEMETKPEDVLAEIHRLQQKEYDTRQTA